MYDFYEIRDIDTGQTLERYLSKDQTIHWLENFGLDLLPLLQIIDLDYAGWACNYTNAEVWYSKNFLYLTSP